MTGTKSHFRINHYTSQEDKEFVVKKYAEEIALGRLSHGYDPDELFSLIGHFHTTLLQLLIKVQQMLHHCKPLISKE